jgi:peptidase E
MAPLRFHIGRALRIGTGCSAGGFLAFTSGETSKSGDVINLQKDAITLIETQIIIAYGKAVKP